jgi:hypothetical protein
MWWRTKGLFDSESGKQLHVGVVFIDVAPVSCYDVLGCLCVDVLEWSEVQLPVRSLLHSVFDIPCSIFLYFDIPTRSDQRCVISFQTFIDTGMPCSIFPILILAIFSPGYRM